METSVHFVACNATVTHYELSFNSQQCKILLCLPKRPEWLCV